MKVSVNCKLDTNSAYGFIKPLADIRYISKVDVFRDYESLPHEKIEYHKPLFGRIGLLGQLLKLFAMLKIIKNDNKLVIGIYEIPHGLLAFLIGKLRRIPIVISIVGNPGYKVIRKGIRKKITYFMYNRISAITVMGTHSRNYLIKDGIISKNIFILTGPIDIGYFREIPSIDKKYDIISIGRLSPEKELLNLIEIASLIKKTHPKIKIGIAGDGPEKIRLEEEICRLKLNNNIDMVGYLNGPVEFYNSGKVFVLNSSTEGLPHTILEAMACGVPCVVSNVGDIGDLVKDEWTGYLIEDYNDINKYVEVIEKLLEFGDNKKITQRARKCIEKHYTYENTRILWENIINHIDISNNTG